MALVAPLVLAVIIGSAFGRGVALDADIGIVDADGSAVSEQILSGLDAKFVSGTQSPVTVTRVDSEASARTAIDSDDLDAAIVIPSGFADSLGTETPASILVIVDARKTVAADITRTVALSITSSIDQFRVSPPTGQEVTTREVTGMYDPVTYFAPSMAILFMFLTLGQGARSMIVERDEGTLFRLRSMPVPTSSILIGKVAGVMVVGMGSMAVTWIVTSTFFGANWGNPVAVAMVAVATVIAVTGISFLITGLARTAAQADGLVSMVAFVLALLGGNFVQVSLMPDVLGRLALLTPNGWALGAFTDIGAAGAGPAQVIPATVVLIAMGVFATAIGLWGSKAILNGVSGR